MSTLRIPAVYMRGGTSKGVFFRSDWLPADPALRDRLLLRILGSPDPYGKQIDGMGGATSSTSKVVVVSRSARADCDVDYLFGQVPLDRPFIDWSGNCGNLTAAVGPFVIAQGLVGACRNGLARVRIWQANIGKRIVARVPMSGGEVEEDGDFELDGVTFPSAEIRLDFLDLGGDDGSGASSSGSGGGGGDRQRGGAGMFPTGNVREWIEVPGDGRYEVTLIDAGNPTVFVDASEFGLDGTELQDDVNGDAALLARCERLRASSAITMGLARSAEEAAARPATPKLAFVAAPRDYVASSGRAVRAVDVALLVRILSMGKLHHAMTGTGAIAIAAAAAVPGTLLHGFVGDRGPPARFRFGHPSGTLEVGASVERRGEGWVVDAVSLSRSARRLMEGHVLVPASVLGDADRECGLASARGSASDTRSSVAARRDAPRSPRTRARG